MSTLARWLLPLVLLSATRTWAAFPLSTPTRQARVLVAADEPASVRLAAADLVSDVRRISGRTIDVVDNREACPTPCVMLATASGPSSATLIQQHAPDALPELRGKWEAYRVRTVGDNILLIAGSDERGTMWGLYALLEDVLGVDPLHHWTGLQPKRNTDLQLASVDLRSDGPTFRYRGWFLNDEDLLTEWREGGGKRHIAYPFYHQVIAPEVADKVFESILRLRFNLVIPSSFVDITNPDEEALIAKASRRGLFVTMHHVEPMGVSGFAFQNYWAKRQRNVPFSFVQHPQAFEEVWRFYARSWARYPNVVWQLGLRGIADRPVWTSDPSVPATPEGRSKLISDAIAKQWEIVRSVDKRPQPPATTTLWMEGTDLNKRGVLRFPEGVAVVLADNGPGWAWGRDFYDAPREPGRPYGVYEHHQFWSYGPHLVQGVSPQLAHALIGEAVQTNATHYALLNVGNIREFPLGIAASASMLRDFAVFSPDEFVAQWCRTRFGAAAEEAAAGYRGLFAGYLVQDLRQAGASRGLTMSESAQAPVLLDGQMLAAAKRLSARLLSRMSGSVRDTVEAPAALALLQQRASQQQASWREALRHAAAARDHATGEPASLLDANLLGQLRMAVGLAATVAALAHAAGSDGTNPDDIAAAVRGMDEVRTGLTLASQGEWKDWYRGDRKMNLPELDHQVRELHELTRSGPAGARNASVPTGAQP